MEQTACSRRRKPGPAACSPGSCRSIHEFRGGDLFHVVVLGLHTGAQAVRIHVMNSFETTRARSVPLDSKGFFAIEQIAAGFPRRRIGFGGLGPRGHVVPDEGGEAEECEGGGRAGLGQAVERRGRRYMNGPP